MPYLRLLEPVSAVSVTDGTMCVCERERESEKERERKF